MNDISELVEIMARLRNPVAGCPWDLEQNFQSIAPYTIEEAYEVADAIARGEMSELCEELGDLLFQVIYHARMAQEQALFDLDQVIAGICEKLVRRHPHVFAQEEIADAAAQTLAWDAHKAREKQARGQGNASVLADIPIGLAGADPGGQVGQACRQDRF